MHKHLFRASNPLAKLVRKQFKNYQWEQHSFIAAFLALYRQKRAQALQQQKIGSIDTYALKEECYAQVNLLEIEEQMQIANNDHLEQLFEHFDALHRAARHADLVINRRYEELSRMTDVIDPNKFPIFSLVENMVADGDLVSLWRHKKRGEEVMRRVRERLGFELVVKPSGLEHHEAGDGVFVSIDSSSELQYVPEGTFLGFVPGIVFEKLKELEKFHARESISFDEYVHRFDDFVVDFKMPLFYPNNLAPSRQDYLELIEQREEIHGSEGIVSIYEVRGDMLNPYAVGDRLNHPPKDTASNTMFLDLFIPHTFFGQEYMRFLPNLEASTVPQKFTTNALQSTAVDIRRKPHDFARAVGFFALRDLYDGEELFVNYFENSMFDIAQTRDWLVRPPPQSPFFKKEEFETQYTIFAKLINAYLFRKHASQYEKFEQLVQHDISRHKYEEENYFKKKLENKSSKK